MCVSLIAMHIVCKRRYVIDLATLVVNSVQKKNIFCIQGSQYMMVIVYTYITTLQLKLVRKVVVEC